MFEEWAHDYEALSLFPTYCGNACPKIDRDMLRRLNEARRFGQGIFYSRQTLYAQYDMKIYGDKPVDVMDTWVEMEGNTLQGYDPGYPVSGAVRTCRQWLFGGILWLSLVESAGAGYALALQWPADESAGREVLPGKRFWNGEANCLPTGWSGIFWDVRRTVPRFMKTFAVLNRRNERIEPVVTGTMLVRIPTGNVTY